MQKYWIDALVVLAYFAVILWIGLSQRSKNDSVEGFALGDRQMPWWAVLTSILAAEISAATFLGAPGEGFAKRNWTYAQLVIGTIMARVVVSYLFIPLYYRHGVVSIYEFLGKRFGIATQKMASATFLVTRVLAMGTRLYVSALILVMAAETLKGEPASKELKFMLYTGAVILITLLTTVYTAVGGIRAVIWTDFIQVGVLVASLGFTIPFLLGKVGGWEAVQSQVQPPVFFDLLPTQEGETVAAWLKRMFSSEYTIYSAFIASTFVTMATHGIDQDTVQRMLTAKNRRQSAFATIMSGVVDLPVVLAFVLVGVLLNTFYAMNPAEGLPQESREVFPFFILHEMSPGLRGLVVAGILATAMGSLSTALNAMATSFSQDFLLPRIKRKQGGEVNQATEVRCMRRSTVLFAVLIILVGVTTSYYMAHHPEQRIIPLVLGILGFTFGSLLGLFLVAFFTKRRGSDLGNAVALGMGVIAVLLASGAHVKPLYGEDAIPAFALAFPWRVTLGALVTTGVALLFPTPVKRGLAESD